MPHFAVAVEVENDEFEMFTTWGKLDQLITFEMKHALLFVVIFFCLKGI